MIQNTSRKVPGIKKHQKTCLGSTPDFPKNQKLRKGEEHRICKGKRNYVRKVPLKAVRFRFSNMVPFFFRKHNDSLSIFSCLRVIRGQTGTS